MAPWISLPSLEQKEGAVEQIHRPLRLGCYGKPLPVQTLSKQIGQVTGEHARSFAPGQPTTGAGGDPRVAVAPVTRMVSEKPYLPVVESMVDGK